MKGLYYLGCKGLGTGNSQSFIINICISFALP